MQLARQSILIADDDRALADSLALRCREAGLQVRVAYDAMQALTQTVENPPDVICLDINMPSGNGLTVCEMIGHHERLKETPVIMLTGRDDEDTIRRCHHLCAYYVRKHTHVWDDLKTLLADLLGAPVGQFDSMVSDGRSGETWITASALAGAPRRTRRDSSGGDAKSPPEALLDAIFEKLGANPDYLSNWPPGRDADQPPWVLMIEDDRDFSWALKLRLETCGIAVVRAFDGTDGYRTAFAYPADAILLDYELPNGNGDYVLRRLKEHPMTKDIPVLILTGRRERSLERQLLSMGATAFLTKPLNMPRLLKELSKHVSILSGDGERRSADATV